MNEMPRDERDTDHDTRPRRSFLLRIAAAAGLTVPASSALAADHDAHVSRLDALEREVESMRRHIGILEDTNAIRRLQYAYGYYIDKCLYEETVALFSDDGEVHFMGGIFRGKSGVRRLYVETFQRIFTDGSNGPLPGFLLDHPQLQAIIDVAPDRRTAKARARSLMQAGNHVDSASPIAERRREQGLPPMQWWEGGIYENEYVRVDGTWRIKVLNYNPIWHAEFEKGWSYTKPEYVPAYSKTYPDDPYGPDDLDPYFAGLWPKTDVIPFHYAHPVTGEPWS